jgi:sugar lactone lactonase YvrE
MITRKSLTLVAVALWGLLAATLASAQSAAQPDHFTFPAFFPFDAGPEGVAVDKTGNVFASVTTWDGAVQVWKFSPSGEKSTLADLGPIGGGSGGLAVNAEGDVCLAVSSMPYNGVYVVDRHGPVARLPGTDSIVYPNALAFDQRGNLYVTETFSLEEPQCGLFGRGGIWRIPRKGIHCGRLGWAGLPNVAELWLRNELLTGTCPPALAAFGYPQLGANGIGFYQGALYVANTDKALVVRVPVLSDGSAGQPQVWKHVSEIPESPLYGSGIPLTLDGLALDVHGNVYLAVPTREAIVRITADGLSQETVAVYPDLPLDVPISLAFGTSKSERRNLFVTNGGFSASIIPWLEWAGPGLVKIEVRISGLPLP